MKNKDDPRKMAQAKRIHDHYKAEGDEMILEFRDDPEYVRRLSEVQRRKAIGGRKIGMGLYQ